MHVATRSQTVNEVPRWFHLDLWSIVRSPIVLMLFSLITFHLGVSLTKGALELVSAPALSSLRQAFGAAILFAVFRPEVRGMNGRQWRVVLGMGASTALMTVLYFLALDRVSP